MDCLTDRKEHFVLVRRARLVFNFFRVLNEETNNTLNQVYVNFASFFMFLAVKIRR